MNWRKLHTNIHYWGASLIIIPFIIILCSGILLQVKNEFNWIQPKTEKIEKSNSNKISLTLKQILQSAMSIQETKISSWKDIKDINNCSKLWGFEDYQHCYSRPEHKNSRTYLTIQSFKEKYSLTL